MKILKVVRDKSFIEIHREIKGQLGEDIEKRTTHEAPMPSFDKALQALVPVACYVLGTGKEWGEEVTVKSITLSYTAKQTRSVRIDFTRQLSSTGSEHPMNTPVFQFDEPSAGEEGERAVNAKYATLIENFIEEAEKYMKGERQQMLLGLAKKEPDAGKKKGKDNPNQTSIPGV